MTDDVFAMARAGFGTKEWAEHNYNIGIGCSHGCIYCYARQKAVEKGIIANREEWTQEKITAQLGRRKFKKLEGVVMFPTQHDITPGNVYTCIATLEGLLEQGNNILIVSKPHLSCIQSICDMVKKYKDQILFRFTIGTLDDLTSKFWEPGAPLPKERLEALRFAFSEGFKTSVSVEPMLEGKDDTIKLYYAVYPFVTHDIWIGKMNFVRERVDISSPEILRMVKNIERQQADPEILDLCYKLYGKDKIQWKESIKKVMAKK